MRSFLKLRVILIVLGFLLLGLFIWFGGPYFAFADWRPLASVTARLVLMALIVAAWGVGILLKRLRAARNSDKLAAAVVQQESGGDKPSAEMLQLRERFEQAVATLKQKRRSGHTLYELPWYVFIGAPGSGKTTALVNSGLHFPLEQRTGKGALRGVGGTRNCDWWFTDEAVFLDTAGRYTTQDSDASADSGAWTEFLALLRKYRKRRPLNGVILTVSAEDLMGRGAPAEYAEAARRRLNELTRELKMQLPVYLMVTKCDLVAGFTEYFDDLTQEGRAQVLGVTFTLDETQKGDGARAFSDELDALVARLNGRVLERVEEDRDVRRRTRMFGFPQQMAALRDTLAAFVSDVFASTRFDQPILLRGVYFTSGTQEGMPIDRLLGAIGRRFAVAPQAVAAPVRGKAYFIERLLKEVLLPESGLAGVNRRLEVQKAAAQLGAYAAMIAIALIGVVVLTVSYRRNLSYVEKVDGDLATLRDLPPASAAQSLDAALPRLERVRAVVDSANRYKDGAPWLMRWGLFQGNALGGAARDAYSRELDGTMLPQVAARFRQRLIEYAAQPERVYPYLKGYLMLHYPEHLDKKQLEYMAGIEWEAAYAADPPKLATVQQHFRSLLENSESLAPVPIDEAIVAQARSTLKQASPEGLVYRYVRIGYANDTAHALRLDLAAGLNADRVLRRKSRGSLSEPVPSIYTKPVFEEITTKGTDEIVKQLASENWVWGDDKPVITQTGDLFAKFLNLYEDDYIATWDRIVSDIQPVPVASVNDAKDSLAILTGPTSPLRGFLKTVDDNTYLVKPPDPAKSGGLFGGKVPTIPGLPPIPGLGQSTAAAVVPGAKITAHFDPIHRLLAGDKGNAPIDGILQQLQQLQQKMAPLGGGVGEKPPTNAAAIAEVGETAKQVKQNAAALPASVASVVNQVADSTTAAVRGGARNTLEARYQQDVARECTTVVDGRYPFVPTSAVDVPLADFGRLFGYGGVYDTFFRSELADLVDTSRSEWAWRSDATGASVGGSLGMLRQFEAAEHIRETFFRIGSQMPEVRFTVTLTYLDVAASKFQIELDGQMFENRHGPERPLPAVWPGPMPGAAAATIEDAAGARPNIVFKGPWAAFRLIDAGVPQRQSDVRYLATFKLGSHEGRAQIEAQSVRNPFGVRDLQQFRCTS
jgi:type VI secretion system protein ImpL